MDYQPPKVIDPNCLEYFLRSYFGQPGSIPGPYTIVPVLGGAEAASSLFNAAGTAIVNGEEKSWSAVVKIVHCTPNMNENPSGFRYWKREAEFYESSLHDNLPGGFRAPFCYGVTEAADGSPWIWMAEIKDAFRRRWKIEQFGEAAHVIGRFNGAYLTGTPLPDYPWLTDHFLEAYLDAGQPAVETLLENWETAVLARYCEPSYKLFCQEAWTNRGKYLDALRRLPRVFSHQDAFYRNLFWQPTSAENKLLAVDWAYAGNEALGSELAPLIYGTVAFGGFTDILQLESVALENYIEGLHHAGWLGNPKLVRFGYTASCFYRYLFAASIGEGYFILQDENNHPMVEQLFGISVDDLLKGIAAQGVYFMKLYQQAQTLGHELGLFE